MVGPETSSTRIGSIVTLVDSNILVYSLDPRDRVKQQQSEAVLRGLAFDGSLVLSVQCLTEFFRVSTQRLRPPLPLEVAAVRAEDFAAAARVLDLTSDAVLKACHAAVRHSISIWDALTWAVASTNGVPMILTEDTDDGRIFEGVLYRNPFVPGFDLSQLQS